MVRWLFAVTTLLLVGCQQLSVNTSHDPYAQFSVYRSFDWMPEKTVSLPADQQLLNQQLKFTVEQELGKKGIVRDETAPDFLISYYGSSEQKSAERLVEHGNYWGHRDRYDHYRRDADNTTHHDRKHPQQQRTRVDYTRTIETQTIHYTEGTLVIDFFDQGSGKVVWQSTIQGVLSKNDPVQSITQAIRKALEQFPPQP